MTDNEPERPRLWMVEIHEDDWDYDNFVGAVVWAVGEAEAESIVRAAVRHPAEGTWREVKWIESDAWRLRVTPAPTDGIALIHWHAG